MSSTSIRIKRETEQRLKKYGFLTETWDDVLKRLMDHCWKCDPYWNEWYS